MNLHKNNIAQSVNDKIVTGLAIIKMPSFILMSCLLQLYYAFVYSYLYYDIEFWEFSQIQFFYYRNVQLNSLCMLTFINTVCQLFKRSILLLEDIFKYLILCLMFHVFHNNYPTIFNCMFTKLDSLSNYCIRFSTKIFLCIIIKLNLKNIL